ncbi:PA2169 family four-helix-bundle protein [Mucilaginibacter terrae]|uniref:ferritin-like domain-containing protein n=1 Tax=Mucilaginibacter terrae TaxID=1955052 RepID=UPI00363BE3FA
MDNQLKQTSEGLNHLIIIANDGKEGYAQAANHVGNLILKAVFTRNSATRANFAEELSGLVIATGTEPESGTGPLGALHRVWIDIKTSFVSNNDQAVLKECSRGDEAAVSAYHTVLNSNGLTDEQRNILEKQLKLTKDSLFSLQQELKTHV